MKKSLISALIMSILLVPGAENIQANMIHTTGRYYEDVGVMKSYYKNIIEAESFTNSSGGTLKVESSIIANNEKITNIGGTYNNAWISYSDIDFSASGGDYVNVSYSNNSDRCANDSRLEIRLDSLDGEIVGEVSLSSTGKSWSEYREVKAKLNTTVEGVHDIYIVMKGDTSSKPYIANIDYLYFNEDEPYERVESEGFNSSSGGSLKIENTSIANSENISNVGGTYSGAWLGYKGLDFEDTGADAINIRYVNNEGRCATDSKIEIRLDSLDGEIIGELDIPSTGGSWSSYKEVKGKLNRVVTGKHDIYLVMSGSTNSSRPYIANFDYFYFDEFIKDEEVKYVVDLIDNIGEVVYTGEILDKIVLAEQAYNKLNDKQKSEVRNLNILAMARAKYNRLIVENEDDVLAYNIIQMENKDKDSGQGLKIEETILGNGEKITNIGGTYDGAWMSYKNVNFDGVGANSITVNYANNSNRCASDAKLEIRLGSIDGEIIGTIELPPTGGDWLSYDKATAKLDKVVAGIHDVYVVMSGTTTSNKYISNFDYLYFGQEIDNEKAEKVISLISQIGEVKYDGESLSKIVNAESEYKKLTQSQKDLVTNYDVLVKARAEYDALNDKFSGNRNAYENIEVESMNSNSGFTVKVETTDIGGSAIRNVTGTSDFSYIGFEGVKFEGNGANEITISYANNSTVCPKNSRAEIRLGSKDGEVIGVVELPNTADNWNTYKEAKVELNKVITGTNDIYVVLRGYTTKEHKQVANIDNIKFTQVESN